MEYPQITQITQISARTSGRAKRPQKPWLYHKRSLAFLGRQETSAPPSDRTAVPPNDVSIAQVAINPKPKSAKSV
jgi:hypothetical protein